MKALFAMLLLCTTSLPAFARTAQPGESVVGIPHRESRDARSLVMWSAAAPEGTNAVALQYTFRSGTVQIDWHGLRDMLSIPDGERDDISLEVFPGEVFVLDGGSLHNDVNDGTTLVARLASGESGVFIMSFAGIRAYGMFEVGLRRFLFQSIPGAEFGTLRVGEVDHAAFPGCGTGGSEREWTAWQKRLRTSAAVNHAKSQPSPHTVIESQLLYSPAVESNQGGDPAAFINTLSASLTAAMNASSVSGSHRVVRYKLINFTEPNPLSGSPMNDYIQYYLDQEVSPFNTIESDRTNYRSDLVTLLVDGNVIAPSGGDPAYCGRSQIPSYTTDDELAFTVVSDGCAAGDLTFAHEVSHTLGGRHDYVLDGNNDVDFGGTNHGYTNTTVDFRTVMGSRGTCSLSGCARLSRYSDPAQSAVVGGNSYALGVTDDDSMTAGNQTPNMVSTLSNSIPSVVLYKASGDAAPSQPSSMTVDRLCSGNNELSWPTPSGTIGWYDVQSSTSSGYSPTVDEYRGGQESLILNVPGTRWVRVRSCNAEGCSSWRNGSQTATTSCP